jgi:hypothetical protein
MARAIGARFTWHKQLDVVVELRGHEHGFEIVHAGDRNGGERRLSVGEIGLGLHQGRPRFRDERLPVGIEALQPSAPAALAGRHAALGFPFFRIGLCPGIEGPGIGQAALGIAERTAGRAFEIWESATLV